MLDLIDEFLPTLDMNDSSYAVRMQGVNQVRKGLAMTVAGSLQTLTERQSYRTSELKRFAVHMKATVPEILPRLSNGSRKESIIRLQSFKNDPKMQDLNPELSELVAAVESTPVGAGSCALMWRAS
jgi:hypothetical protein